MSETLAAGPRAPRIILEDEAGPARVEARPPAVIAPVREPRAGPSTLTVAAGGVAVLLLGLSAIESGIFVADALARHAVLGWLTLAVAASGYGLLGWALWREVRGLTALRAVDETRAAFARGDFHAAKSHALSWAEGIAVAAPHLAALRNAPDLLSLRALLESGPLAALDADARAVGRVAAVQGFAATAIAPSPSWDALVIGWRGLRLVRQVAALHGMRPGALATLGLLRRAAFDAAAVAATEVATDTAVRAVVTNPLLQHVIGEAATGGVAARRLITLARATAGACRIVPRD